MVSSFAADQKLPIFWQLLIQNRCNLCHMTRSARYMHMFPTMFVHDGHLSDNDSLQWTVLNRTRPKMIPLSACDINLDEHLPSKNPIIYFLAVWVFGNLIFFFGYPEFEALPSPYVEKRSYAQPAGNKLRIPLTHSSFHSFDGRNSI